jgi:hypothetical protein
MLAAVEQQNGSSAHQMRSAAASAGLPADGHAGQHAQPVRSAMRASN